MATTNKYSYDDPNFAQIREARMTSVQAGVSLLEFGHFFCRNRSLVRSVSIRLASAASAAAGSLAICRRRNAPSNTSLQTLGFYSLVSATSVGSMGTVTLTANNTLESLHDQIVCILNGNDKGNWDLVYEYQLLPAMNYLS